jgi:pimeloyl-ACP methyl ester carboxylesterase
MRTPLRQTLDHGGRAGFRPWSNGWPEDWRMMRIIWAVCVLSLLTPRPGRGADEAANPLDKAPSRFARLDDIRIHYKSLGEGETAVVFIHGWTCDLTFWRAQAVAFDGQVRMVFIDLPGHGKSDKPKIDYTADLFARAINAVLEDAGVKSAVLVGHSMGTPVVRQFYRLYPKKTRALVGVDGALRPFTTKKEDIDRFVGRFSGPNYKEVVGAAVDSMFTQGTPAEVRKAVKEVMLSAPQHVVVGAMKGTLDPAIWKDDAITVPLQMILAKRSRWTKDDEDYARKLAPQVDYRLLDGVGHFLMLEKPREFNQALAEFLKKQGVLKP